MRLLPDFSPKKNETALGFGLSWSLVGSALALTYLASCAYLVPDSPNAPRYNTVLGEKRVPPKNNAPLDAQTAPLRSPQPQMVPAAPPPQYYYQPQPQSQLTPMAPTTQEQPFVQNTPPLAQRNETATVAPIQDDYSWWNPSGWFSDAKPAEPRNHTAVPRQTPSMNAQAGATGYSSQMTALQPLSAADGYPVLQETPQSPLVTGEADARERLGHARTDLQAELDAANMRANQLRYEAASGESILSTMPQYHQPDPMAPRAEQPAARPSVVRPDSSTIISGDLPPAKVARPGTSGNLSNDMMVEEPVTLTPPSGKGRPIESAGMSTGVSTMAPSTSGFDPMAGATTPIELTPPEAGGRGTRYLPESRYVNRR